jgi:hypothetical protein
MEGTEFDMQKSDRKNYSEKKCELLLNRLRFERDAYVGRSLLSYDNLPHCRRAAIAILIMSRAICGTFVRLAHTLEKK